MDPLARLPLPRSASMPSTNTLDDAQLVDSFPSLDLSSVTSSLSDEEIERETGRQLEERIAEILRTPAPNKSAGSSRNPSPGLPPPRSFTVACWGTHGWGAHRASTTSSSAAAAAAAAAIAARPMVDAAVSLDHFKTRKCPQAHACLQRDAIADCPYYHGENDRRRAADCKYKPLLCKFGPECRKGDRCAYSHNDFERRYHPGRWKQETCRDFLRGDCPRTYCTFKHEISEKVRVSLAQIDEMDDKEMLQLVLKISEKKGKPLCEKLMRRFASHGKKHSGWRLEGFDARGEGIQTVRFITARVETLKKILRTAGEERWASTMRTTGLRDMMSGVRKVAEEVRERFRDTERGDALHQMIRSVFSSTNWSCHSQDGTNPFVVTPQNQNDALTALEKLVERVVAFKALPPPRPVPLERDDALFNSRLFYGPTTNVPTKIAVSNWA